MSWRDKLLERRQTVGRDAGSRGLDVFKDYESRTYRIFTKEGIDDSGRGQSVSSCACVDLTIEEFRSLVIELGEIATKHKPWPANDDEGDE
jgi:hypothetical protein